jgi:hypothetical protein
MSYWLYIHPELSGKPNYWKVGKALTPYSAVRARQRFLVDDFYLTEVWFGKPEHIAKLERVVKYLQSPKGDDKLGPGRTELVYFDPEKEIFSLASYIEMIIFSHKLKVKRMYTGSKGYHATNSSQCPLGCEQERYAHEWSKRKLREEFKVR